MTKYFTNNLPTLNLYKKPSLKSEIVTQMIFGDSFSIFGRKRNWLKVKIKEDGYKGFIKNKVFPNFLKPTHKVNILKAKQLTNFRASGKDDGIKLTPPKKMSLEQLMSYINDDELLEVTPTSLRLRKKLLCPHERKKAGRT